MPAPIVECLVSILESFYMREEPRGVAFAGASFADVTFGRPPAPHLSRLESFDGFVQLHFEYLWVSAYALSFGRDKWLIVQFPFQYEEPPPVRPWNAFVRLAMDVQRCLDNPTHSEGPPFAGAPVLRPLPPAPHSRLTSAEAPVPDDPE